MQLGYFGGIFGWLFLPQLAAKYALRIAHAVLLRIAPRMVPHPNTSTYKIHQRIAYVFVILLYFVYSLWSTEQELGANYYHMLGVTPNAFSEEMLRRNFRKLSLVMHPDKNTGNEQQFIIIQEAYKVLSRPEMRFVYDHAGTVAVKCQSCVSVSDFMLAAIPQRLGMYMAYMLGNVVFQVFRIGRYGAYWRYIAIGAFAALELMMMTSTRNPLIIRILLWTMPHRTGFEIAQIMQQAMVCFFVALNQIGPQLIPEESNVNTLSLAKELYASIQKVRSEVDGGVRQIIGMYQDTGLKQQLQEQFQKELQLGMTIGSNKKFQEEYTTRLNNERLNNM
ncbi:hypothetical protein GGI25_002285 [Coemansia spiralis]|uniref:J domain-containing protein n=2 Tax=Coemansia TaxID=4863 RepID=A0A9W8KZ70_9FUNG|nr:hypothetical protein BX070DRAFT_219659 [Coemansia spiralis]KAJ1995269.1 hypothetical protein EDC05_001107 [Coemansia umbellata]KAJ2625671.1 hypothetical protein GGI26_000471 [Coemansia sp. RSA 1358]KAJ2678491.1 hypothetical protein GGI25_002285 [Coemansia spiralis]